MIVLECFPIGKEKAALRARKEKRIIPQRPLPCSQGSSSETHTKTCTCSRPRRHTPAICFIPHPAPFRRSRVPFRQNPGPAGLNQQRPRSKILKQEVPCPSMNTSAIPARTHSQKF